MFGFIFWKYFWEKIWNYPGSLLTLHLWNKKGGMAMICFLIVLICINVKWLKGNTATNLPNTGNTSVVSVEGQCMSQHHIIVMGNIENIN